MVEQNRLYNRFIVLLRLAVPLSLIVIMLGAYVRLSDAGLGCPDWPGCYGQLLGVPQSPAEVSTADQRQSFDLGKAWREVAHRYVAGLLGLLIAALAVIAWLNRRDQRQPLILPGALLFLVILQSLLGMWTVTLLLKPAVVTVHLLGGIILITMLWYALLITHPRLLPPPHWTAPGRLTAAAGWTDPGRSTAATSWTAAGRLAPGRVTPAAGRLAAVPDWTAPGWLPPAMFLILFLLFVQIILGGWMSSNYAALACLDFPTCHGYWWPPLDFAGAISPLFAKAGQNFEFGILDHAARMTIHFIHRLGALLLSLMMFTALAFLFLWGHTTLRCVIVLTSLLLLTQIALGIANVVFGLPIAVAVAHNGVAVLLVLAWLTLSIMVQRATSR